jgi:hypothetical protein
MEIDGKQITNSSNALITKARAACLVALALVARDFTHETSVSFIVC